MRVVIYMADKDFDRVVLGAFSHGASSQGASTCVVGQYLGVDQSADVAVIRGVAGRSRLILDDYLAAGKHVIYIDKGYTRIPAQNRSTGVGLEYFKVSLNGFQPRNLMDRSSSDVRWRWLQTRFGLKMSPRKFDGMNVVYSGPSAKNAKFHGLGDATELAKSVVDELISMTTRPIVYRPKQSWINAAPVPGALFSQPPEKLVDVLDDAWVFIVQNSNSCVEAMLRGIPVISLGDSVAKPVSGRGLDMVNVPYFPSERECEQWMANVCWWQWTVDEIASGETWKFLRSFM